MNIREAKGNDAPEIQELLFDLTGDKNVCVLSKRVEEILSNENSFLLVAELNNQVVGTAQLTMCPDVMYKFQPYAIAENIVVKSELQRQGIGKALMAKIDEISKNNNCSKIMIFSSSARQAAHKFFESAGYSSEVKKGFVKYGSTIN